MGIFAMLVLFHLTVLYLVRFGCYLSEAFYFPMEERNAVDPEGREGRWGQTRSSRGRGNIIKIYFMRKTSILIFKK